MMAPMSKYTPRAMPGIPRSQLNRVNPSIFLGVSFVSLRFSGRLLMEDIWGTSINRGLEGVSLSALLVSCGLLSHSEGFKRDIGDFGLSIADVSRSEFVITVASVVSWSVSIPGACLSVWSVWGGLPGLAPAVGAEWLLPECRKSRWYPLL